jgi:hypothetical protein
MTIPIHDRESSDVRAFARVDAELLMAMRVVPAGEHHQVCSRLHSPHLFFEAPPMDVRDTALAEWLNLLNRKLDAVLKELELREDSAHGLTPHTVNIGAGGMSARVASGLNIGEIVEITMRLPFNKPMVVSVCGEVIETSADVINVRFIAVPDEIRDLIVRYVFQKQREIMLSQRKD